MVHALASMYYVIPLTETSENILPVELLITHRYSPESSSVMLTTIILDVLTPCALEGRLLYLFSQM